MDKEQQQLNGWEIWQRNWENAKKFFDSKGNVNTRSKLKTKWFNEFRKDLEEVYEINNLCNNKEKK